MKAEAAGEVFTAQGKIVKNMGWKEAYEGTWSDEDEEEFQKLSERKEGETLKIEQAELTVGKTKPPAAFTEATLLSAMENPVKYMETAG